MRVRGTSLHSSTRRAGGPARLVAAVSEILTQAAELFCEVAVVVMSGLVLLQVVLRYVFAAPLPWVEEASVFLMVWIAFVGASVALRKGVHVAMNLLVERLPVALARQLLRLSQGATLIFLVILGWKGCLLAASAYTQRSSGLGLPMMWPYLAIPVGSCLMAIHLLRSLIEEG